MEWRNGYPSGAAACGVERWLPVVEATPAMLFGSMLRRMREQAGLTQAELARRVSYSASLISAVELGAKPAKQDLVERLDKELSASGLLLEVWPILISSAHRHCLPKDRYGS